MFPEKTHSGYNCAPRPSRTVTIISQSRKPLDAKESAKPTLEKIYGSGAKSKHSS
jgi:hypothetical protein